MSKARLVVTALFVENQTPSEVAANGRLHHIGAGRTHARTYVRLLIHDLNITIIETTTGEILRELVLDPHRDYRPTGAPKGPTPK